MKVHQRLVRLPLVSGTKRPLLSQWSSPVLDEDTISKIFQEHPDAGVGLRLDQFVVVDCDSPERVDWWLGVGPETPYQSRGNPDHRSFWYTSDPDDEIRPFRRLDLGFEVKCGPGHQCVVPPSIHPSGRRYEWLGPPVDSETIEDVPALPGAVLAALVADLPQPGFAGDGEGWDAVLEGEGRDNFLIAVAGFLRRRGASERAVRAGISAMNQTFCEPRLPAGDLNRIARSSTRWGSEGELRMDTDWTDLEAAIDASAEL